MAPLSRFQSRCGTLGVYFGWIQVIYAKTPFLIRILAHSKAQFQTVIWESHHLVPCPLTLKSLNHLSVRRSFLNFRATALESTGFWGRSPGCLAVVTILKAHGHPLLDQAACEDDDGDVGSICNHYYQFYFSIKVLQLPLTARDADYWATLSVA